MGMPESTFRNISQIIAVGDVHGNYAGFRSILQYCGVIDKKERWMARDTHLVQLGDVLGRGGEPGKIFRLLKRLEEEAPKFGSRVHLLLGNHEAMSMRGLLMYNTVAEFEDLARENFLDAPAGKTGAWEETGSEAEAKFGKRLAMMGCREFQDCLSPAGKVGHWLAHHDSAVTINDCLFVHGGLNREYGFQPLDRINEQVRTELSARPDPEKGASVMLGRDGPQWNRDFPLRPSPEKEKELEEVLDYHRCHRMVVGHTPTSCIDPAMAGRILPLYGGKLYCIDTGIGNAYGGNLSALRIADRGLSAVYP
jgi:hypothetical protein